MWTSTPAGCLIGDNCNSDVGGEPDALKGASPVRRGAEGRSLRDATRPTLRYAPEPAPDLPESERLATVEAFIAALGIDTVYGSASAYYHIAEDRIHMPDFSAFHDAHGFYATHIHEAAHASGAAHRLDRDFSAKWTRHALAMEEATAELTASFLLADLGIAHEPRPDHAAYIASWLQLLKDEPRAIFTAASKAQAAADWMHARQP